MSTSGNHNASSVDEFCSSPRNHTVLKRQSAVDDNASLQSFVMTDRSFSQQYSNIYFVRLLKLRMLALAVAEERWGSLPDKPEYIPKVLDVHSGELCFVIGTVYMDMALKPNILRDLSSESSIVAPSLPPKYRGDSDSIFLEDESGRIELSGARLSKEFLVTGIVISVLGKETASGSFEVLDVCYPGVPPQAPLPKPQTSDADKYVALISGLNLGPDATSELKTQLLIEFLTGELGSSQDQATSANIARVIVAGNSVAARTYIADDAKPKQYGYDSNRYDASLMLQLDEFLEEVCQTVPVDIMPGAQDPVNKHLPQQPFHKSLFNATRKNQNLHCVTNPYACKLDNTILLGTAGQNVDDIFKYIDGSDRLGVAESCLFWRHIAPSAPDTLWCFPFQDHDPFLLENSPHVYFIGNQPQFETNVLQGPDGQEIRVILVPSFSETGTVVLVNLNTLACKTVRIDDKDITTE